MTENPYSNEDGRIDNWKGVGWNEGCIVGKIKGYNQAIVDFKKEARGHTMRVDEMWKSLEGSPKVPVITLVEVNAVGKALLKKVSE